MPRTELQQFKEGLDAWLDEDPHLRPFVCDGSPLECQVFLVGFNSAKRLQNPFSAYWNDASGFMKSRFLSDYLRERGLVEPIGTRARIERFAAGALPEKCLETNIYAKPSASKRVLARVDPVTGVFDYLLNAIRPKVIVTYSKAPIDFFTAATGRRDFLDGFVDASLNGHEFRLYGIKPHLTYVGFEMAFEMGRMAGREALAIPG